MFIYPHPDDESFGAAHTISRLRREGHEVYLLTLTKGGATRQRHKFGYSIAEMGDVRFKEMLNVEKVLDLTEMVVLDLPDSGLKEMDPREIESVVKAQLLRVKPDVVVTYACYGISGFHDHLVMHAVAKRVFCELRDEGTGPRRLAFQVLTETQVGESPYNIQASPDELIDCLYEVSPEDIATARRALDCYVSFQAVLDATGIKDKVQSPAAFEFFMEDFSPPTADLFDGLT